jgi:mannose-1-phosphate guanylyltransferase
MRALLLAAGMGTRLRPLTDCIPKCLIDIGGRPLLGYWLQLLVAAGISEVVINTHYMADRVRDYVAGQDHPLKLTLVHEDVLLGTGGTLLANRALFFDEPVMLVHADNLSLFEPARFMAHFDSRPKGAEITMMTFCTDSPRSCGIVDVDPDGIVRALYEKSPNPPGNLANAAVYIVAPDVVRFIATLGKAFVDFSTEVLPAYMGRINTFHNDVYHRDIGTVESLAAGRLEYPPVAARFFAAARR